MPTGAPSFKRVVIGLQASAPGGGAVQYAADLANLLRVDLVGLFLEESSLRSLPGISVARELQLPGGGWRPLDLARLTADLELAARGAERMFASAAKRVTAKCQFEIVRGSTAQVIASVSQRGDIVLIAEPPSAERATQQFAWLVEAAFHSAADVMLVPRRFARTTGQIAVIATGPDDPSIRPAAAIALAANEELAIIEGGQFGADDPLTRELASDPRLRIRRVGVAPSPPPGPRSYVDAFRELHERLVVMTRGAQANEAALAITAARHVPVLVIEPPATD